MLVSIMARTQFPIDQNISPKQCGHSKNIYRPSDKNIRSTNKIDEEDPDETSFNKTGEITNLQFTVI